MSERILSKQNTARQENIILVINQLDAQNIVL